MVFALLEGAGEAVHTDGRHASDDPFRELDRLAQQVWGLRNGSRSLAINLDTEQIDANYEQISA